MRTAPSQRGRDDPQNHSLERRLAAYALAGGAVLAAADRASADIMWSGPQNVPINGSTSPVPLDVNGDGTVDFAFFYSTSPFTALAVEGTASTNVIAGTVGTQGNFAKAAALSACAPIPGANSFGQLKFLASNQGGTPHGNWVGAQDKFLGLEFDISGQEHFGWAELSVNPDLTATLEAWGFESTPNTEDMAGAGIPGLPCTPGVPEPTSLALLALGAAGVLAWSRYRRGAGAAPAA